MCIKVWPFYEAPEPYQRLSGHGGDEDWIALVPKDWSEKYIGWAEEGTPFGRCKVSEHKLDDGSLVLIGAHA